MAIAANARYAEGTFSLPYVPGHASSNPFYDFTIGGSTGLSFSQGPGLPVGASVDGISVRVRGCVPAGMDLSSSNYLTLKYKTNELSTFLPSSVVAPGDLGFAPGAWNTTNPDTGLPWTAADIFSGNWTIAYSRGAGGDARDVRIFEVWLTVVYTLTTTTMTPSTGPKGTTITISGGGAHVFVSPGKTDTDSPAVGTYIQNGTTFAITVTVADDDHVSFTIPNDWLGGLNDLYIQTYDGVGLDNSRNLSLTGTDGVNITVASWWLRGVVLFGDLRYRFNQTFNWYRYSLLSPGSGWAAASAPSPYGWFQSTDGFTGAATVIVGGLPADPRSFEEISAFATGPTAMLGGSPGVAAVIDNQLVYAARAYTVGTNLPPIRIFDGIADREFVRLPKTAGGATPKAILSMIVANGTIYLSTFDSGTDKTNWAGRVFSLDIKTGVLAPVGDDVFASGHLPYALAWHNDQLWVGTHRQDLTVVGAVYRIRPDASGAAWTKDHDLSAGQGSVASLLGFNGNLYVGCQNTAGTFAKVLVRTYDGAYATSDTGSGGVAAAGNGYLSLCVFNSKLYAGFWNPDTPNISKIRKFDNSSWADSYTGASSTLLPFVLLFAESSLLYAWGGALTTLKAAIVTTPDGTSWTDQSAQLVGSSQGLPAVGVLVQ